MEERRRRRRGERRAEKSDASSQAESFSVFEEKKVVDIEREKIEIDEGSSDKD